MQAACIVFMGYSPRERRSGSPGWSRLSERCTDSERFCSFSCEFYVVQYTRLRRCFHSIAVEAMSPQLQWSAATFYYQVKQYFSWKFLRGTVVLWVSYVQMHLHGLMVFSLDEGMLE